MNVLRHCCCRFGLARVYEGEINRRSRKVVSNAPELWSIPIGDGAIRSNKQKHVDFAMIPKRICRIPTKDGNLGEGSGQKQKRYAEADKRKERTGEEAGGGPEHEEKLEDEIQSAPDGARRLNDQHAAVYA